MFRTKNRLKFLEYSAEKDIDRINKLEDKIEKGTKIEYGEAHCGLFGESRLDVPVVDVVNSILEHLQLEISHKSYPITTGARVILKSII